ncbi:hypothetical protein U1Q18_024821 [Sarracenia purpurea var. burkii]
MLGSTCLRKRIIAQRCTPVSPVSIFLCSRFRIGSGGLYSGGPYSGGPLLCPSMQVCRFDGVLCFCLWLVPASELSPCLLWRCCPFGVDLVVLGSPAQTWPMACCCCPANLEHLNLWFGYRGWYGLYCVLQKNLVLLSSHGIAVKILICCLLDLLPRSGHAQFLGLDNVSEASGITTHSPKYQCSKDS